MVESTELRGHRGEAERLPIGASPDTEVTPALVRVRVLGMQ